MRLMSRNRHFFVCIAIVIILLVTIPFAAYGYEHQQQDKKEAEKVKSRIELIASQMQASLGPPIAFATLAVVTSSESSNSNYYNNNPNDLEDIFSLSSDDANLKGHEIIDIPPSFIQIQDQVRNMGSKSGIAYVDVTEDSRYLMNITGEAGNIINIVAQLREHRYEDSISIDNCRGYYINVEVRQVDENSNNAVSSTPSAWSLFWNAIATMLDNSAFCELLPTVMLRVEPTPVDRSYYFIINARRGYMALASNFTCKMRVYVEQVSAETVWWQQNAFALILPLFLLICTAPFTLWHIHLIPSYIVDIDILSWMWYPPYVLRDFVLSIVRSLYAIVWGFYAERREQQRQRELEEQHRRIMQEAANRQNAQNTLLTTTSASTLLFQQQHNHHQQSQEEQERQERGEEERRDESNDGSHEKGKEEERGEEEDKHKPTVVRITQSITGAAAKNTGTHSSNKKKRHNAEKQQLLSKQAEEYEEEEDDNMVASTTSPRVITTTTKGTHSPNKCREENNDNNNNSDNNNAPALAVMFAAANNNNNGNGNPSTVTTESHDVAETSTMCVVHVHAPSAPPRELSVNPHTTEDMNNQNHNDNNSSHRKGGVGEENRMFLYKPSENSKPTTGDFNKNNNNNSHRNPEASEDDEDEHICRICRDGPEIERLVSACECTGSVRWVHRSCLDRWRLASAKRNMRHVQRCEICRQPFRVAIRRRTLLLQSSRQVLRTVLLLLCVLTYFVALAVLLHVTFGEMACRTPWRRVSYSTMFSLDGAVVTLFAYLLLTLLAAFAFAAVYSHWHMRAETTAHVQEFQLLPVFWTRRNTMAVCVIYILGIVHALSFGYLLKLLMYRTSTVVWNWEASPSSGAVLYMMFITFIVSLVRWVRDWRTNRNARRQGEEETGIHAVVIEAGQPPPPPQQQQQEQQERERDGHASLTHTNERREEPPAQEGEVNSNTVVPPQMRPIRAVEYCPRRPVINRS
ncbi:zinc finger protein [Trypanosoma melophagium]|uniref:zinc finger protein n=1 Tax=Trypanosoma melophagium TaxID=715481 RepID=UPI00351A4E3E|nr:zinc finger protein [Trypanosoma melophagium]